MVPFWNKTALRCSFNYSKSGLPLTDESSGHEKNRISCGLDHGPMVSTCAMKSLCLAGHATFPAAKIGEDKLVFFQNRMLTQARFVLGCFRHIPTTQNELTTINGFVRF